MRTGNHNELIEIFHVDYKDKSLKNSDDLKKIISGPAYRDMTPRHLKGIGKKPEKKDELFEWLAGEFFEYFDKPTKSKEDFDKWHSNICEQVLETLGGLCDDNVKVHYGKAQKLVNMSFKNFYCFADAEEYEKNGYFANCHMPLDSYTLSWFTQNVCKDKVPSKWSNMDFEEYSEIQTKIREYFNSDRNTTYRNNAPLAPFIAEFYIWEEMRFPEICDSWLYKAGPLSKCSSFDEEITNKITKIRNTANKLLNNANL